MDTPERVMVVITEPLAEGELLDELCRELTSDLSAVALIAPAVGETPMQHGLGDVDGAIREARHRLELSLHALNERGISAFGEIGVGDPVTAAAEALHQYPADLILIVAAPGDRGGWSENGLFKRAQDQLHPTVQMVALEPARSAPPAPPIEKPDTAIAASAHHAGPGSRLPRFSDGDPIAVGIAMFGAIVGIAAVALFLITLFN